MKEDCNLGIKDYKSKSVFFFFFVKILSIVSIFLIIFISCKESTLDIRGNWIMKDSFRPIYENKNINCRKVLFTGTILIGEIIESGNEKSFPFEKVYYYIKKSEVDFYGKIDEISYIHFWGKYINKDKIEGNWYYVGHSFPTVDSGYWEATRVLDEKD